MQRFNFSTMSIAILFIYFTFGCQEHHSLEVKDLLSLKVEVERNRSCERCENYLDFSTCTNPAVFTVTVTALDADGAVCTDFNRPVRLRVVPGEIEIIGLRIPQKELWYKGAVLHLRNGKAKTLMALRKAYGGNVRIWVEDSLDRWQCSLFCGEIYWGEEPRTMDPDSEIQECCGIPGTNLFEKAPDREPTFVGAVSDRICFLTPSIRDVQEPTPGDGSPVVVSSHYSREEDSGIEMSSGDGDRRIASDETYPSPLDGESITIKRGSLVVSSTVGDGFYFTDVDPWTAGDPPAFNHGFAYNYSYPEGLLPGDIISEVSGILTEFFGFTEMSFPAWEKKVRAGGPGGSGPQCMGTDLVTSRGSNEVESASVDFRACGVREGVDRLNVTISSYEDIGGVYEIDHIDKVDSHKLYLKKDFEITSNAIPFSVSEVYEQFLPAKELVASETTNNLIMEQYECGLVEVTDAVIKSVSLGDYYEYGQWPVDIGGGSGADLNIVTRNILPDFDPSKNVGKTIEVLRGMLRQHQYAEPQWIIYPRSHTDITCTECDPPL